MSRHAKALKYALAVLQNKYGDKIQSLYLYGSCARGDQQYDSDVDILVVSDTLTKKEIHQMKLDVISDDYTLPEVELKITDGQISDKWFLENIKKDGVLLWEK